MGVGHSLQYRDVLCMLLTISFFSGRCARAGRKGEAFSLVTTDELCYLLDLHLFLGRPLSMVTSEEKVEAGKDGYFGRIPQTLIEEELSAFISWSDTCCEIVSYSFT